jgi:hypothetical protein
MRALTISTALGTTLVIAGCGGATKPQNTSAGGPSGGVRAAYEFSACMRSHGVTNFPDPIVHSSAGSQSIGIKVDPSETSSPAFKSAQQACQHFMPAPSPAQQAAESRAHAEHLLAFARCMRAHGVTSFPDPNSQGDIPMSLLARAGINIHLPNVISAARACVPASGGLLTQAAISQATGSSSSQPGGGGGSQSGGGGG